MATKNFPKVSVDALNSNAMPNNQGEVSVIDFTASLTFRDVYIIVVKNIWFGFLRPVGECKDGHL